MVNTLICMVFDTEKYTDSSEFESNINHLVEAWDYVYVSQFYKAVNGVKLYAWY